MPIQKLESCTRRLISSSQVITSITSVVKELVENAIDAGATSIEVKLENNGLDLIEVKDDGTGVSKEDVLRMCLVGYTSKIITYEDIGISTDYGFRGEALASLCNVANVSISTKTKEDNIAMTYTFDQNGSVVHSRPSHIPKGTQITVTRLFYNIPVRRQNLIRGRHSQDEVRTVEQMLKNFAVIHPPLRITLWNNKCRIWQKISALNYQDCLLQVLGYNIWNQMEKVETKFGQIWTPKKDCSNISMLCKSSVDNMMIFVNKRPVRIKHLEKIIVKMLQNYYNTTYPNRKFPVCFVNLTLPGRDVDVNLEPNKTKVLCKNEDEIYEEVQSALSMYYSSSDRSNQSVIQKKSNIIEVNDNKRIKLDSNVADIQHTPEINALQTVNIVTSNYNSSLEQHTHTVTSDVCDQTDVDISVSELSDSGAIVDNQFSSDKSQLIVPLHHQTIETAFQTNTSAHLANKEQSSADCGRCDNLNPIKCTDHSKSVNLPDLFENDDIFLGFDENSKENESTSLISNKCSISINDWSRGKVKINNKEIQGSTVLTFGNTENKCENLNLSMESTSSQMGRKEHKAFTKFCREMRPKILQENPGMLFTKVASLLVRKWQELSSEQKNDYETVAKERIVDTRNKKNVTMEENVNFSSIGQVLENVPNRKKLEINLKFDDIKDHNKKFVERNADNGNIFSLVGQLLPEGVWLYVHEQKLGIIRHWALQEVVISERMMSEFSVPVTKLGFKQQLSSGLIGENLWKLLISLEQAYDASTDSYVISNPVISKNGFRIEIENVFNNQPDIFLTHVASITRFYGLADLQEVLLLARENGTDLRKCRPLKIANYIKGAAVAECRSNTSIDQHKLMDMLSFWQKYIGKNECLHSKQILFSFSNLADV